MGKETSVPKVYFAYPRSYELGERIREYIRNNLSRRFVEVWEPVEEIIEKNEHGRMLEPAQMVSINRARMKDSECLVAILDSRLDEKSDNPETNVVADIATYSAMDEGKIFGLLQSEDSAEKIGFALLGCITLSGGKLCKNPDELFKALDDYLNKKYWVRDPR